jgi:Asp-tRNA(Asn)/Glu-tRNA(Gln) amidotransferase A subunit family amidase
LPLAMQLAAPAGTDDRLLAVAAWCETRVGGLPSGGPVLAG